MSQVLAEDESRMERIFLGWEEPVLGPTARWLLDHFPDLSEVRVVVRGARAGRRLLEKLAVEAERQKRPLFLPKIATIAAMADDLLEPPEGLLPAASDLIQKLAWLEALLCLPKEKKAIVWQVPGGMESSGGSRTELLLAGRMQQLWSEVSGDGLRFADVAEAMETKMPEAPEQEVERWRVLEETYGEYGKILRGEGWLDPAERRAVLAEKGKAKRGSVVLAGVVEIRPVFLKILQRLPQPPHVLIFAPVEESGGFDEFGRLRPEVWAKRSAGLREGQIYPVVRAADQSAKLSEMAQQWPGLTLGIPDEKAVAGIREGLREAGLESHWAEGKKMGLGRLAGFLRALVEYGSAPAGEAPSWEAAALLLRHPDGLGEKLDASEIMDDYAAEHIPERMDPPPESAAGKVAEELRQRLDWNSAEDTAAGHAEKMTQMLLRIYGDKEVKLEVPSGRMMRDSLQAVRKVMAELADLRLPFLRKMRPSEFLRLVIGEIEEGRVPEPAQDGAVEMVGWLELVEEDSPAVAVASFHEGAVPGSVTSDEFLPGHLREILALHDNEQRLARDAYVLAVVQGTRAKGRGVVGLVVPSFGPTGDPVKPSRLLLSGLKGLELAARVLALTEKVESKVEKKGGEVGRGFGALPAGKEKIEKVSVTAFRDYLMSPRYFYFARGLRLEEVEDEPGELSAPGFGTLIHRVVGAFAKEKKVRESVCPKEIGNFLIAELGRRARETFGDRPKATVGWQLELAGERLEAFARVQAQERAAGWQIVLAEEEKSGALPEFCLEDGKGRKLQVKGRPDRMDWNEKLGRWRIVDVKTSSTAISPDRAHQGADGTWKDLQMPLYRELAPAVLGEAGTKWDPEKCDLVYFQLPKDGEKATISSPMNSDLVSSALEKAKEVAGEILDGNWEKIGELDPERTGPTFLALCGQAGIPQEMEQEEES